MPARTCGKPPRLTKSTSGAIFWRPRSWSGRCWGSVRALAGGLRGHGRGSGDISGPTRSAAPATDKARDGKFSTCPMEMALLRASWTKGSNAKHRKTRHLSLVHGLRCGFAPSTACENGTDDPIDQMAGRGQCEVSIIWSARAACRPS